MDTTQVAAERKEILEKLKELCAFDDIESVNSEVNNLSDEFVQLTEKINEAQQKEQAKDEKDDEIVAVADDRPDDLFDAYKIILKAFTEKKSAFFKKKKEEEEKNYEQKKSLLDELQKIVKDEENIGKAFARVNEIKEGWNEIGSIGRMREQDMQSSYSKLMEEFHYNINIYKEIKDHDLKRNYQLKKDVIDKLKLLLEKEENIKTVESSMRALQNDWENIGGTYQEKWEELKEEYWITVRGIYDKIRAHYEGRRRIMAQNFETKKELLNTLKELVEPLPENHKEWDQKTTELKAIQKTWNEVGITPRKDNKDLWKEFRAVCDTFFDAKKEFYSERHDQFDQVKENKERLITKVSEVKNSSDWKQTANFIIGIQKQWKKLGSAGPKNEQKLWHKFRGECDHFFSRRDEHFAKLSVEEDENLKKKNQFINELKTIELPGEQDQALQLLEEKVKEFQTIGKVPFKKRKQVYQSFKETIQSHYDKLDLAPDQKEQQLFKSKIETLKAAPDAGKKIGHEKDKIRKQIKRIQDEITQYENNLGFFSNSKGANALKEEVEKNIEDRKAEIKTLKEKLSLLK